MINTKQGVWLLGILGLIIAALLGILFFVPAENKWRETPLLPNPGITIFSPRANAEIFSPLKITGVVNGDGWAGFEGQVGTAKLLDKNGKQLGEVAILAATTDWMNPHVSFEANLVFISGAEQPGTIVFSNENPSGIPEKDKTFILPVKIKKSSEETMQVKVYFMNNNLDPEILCNKAFSVQREVLKTEAVARVALGELLRGPNATEEKMGFFTSINREVKIQSLIIENGTAKADFDEQLQYQVGGSCRVSAIRAQIEQTLKQFPIVKNVVISINGRTEDILQP